MIVANIRHRLTRDDAQLVLQLIAGGSRDEQLHGEAILREGGLDELLDDPRLLPALMERRQGACSSLPLLAYVLVREALCRTGERDRGLADYVTSILLHFGFGGRAQRIAAYDDEIYDTLAALLRDVDVGDPTRAFLVRAQLGNYALWFSGIFPDFIESQRFRRGGPDLGYYEDMGRRGYELATLRAVRAQERRDESRGIVQELAVELGLPAQDALRPFVLGVAAQAHEAAIFVALDEHAAGVGTIERTSRRRGAGHGDCGLRFARVRVRERSR